MAYTTKKNEKIEIYLNSKIVSYENHFESFNVKKNKLEGRLFYGLPFFIYILEWTVKL